MRKDEQVVAVKVNLRLFGGLFLTRSSFWKTNWGETSSSESDSPTWLSICVRETNCGIDSSFQCTWRSKDLDLNWRLVCVGPNKRCVCACVCVCVRVRPHACLRESTNNFIRAHPLRLGLVKNIHLLFFYRKTASTWNPRDISNQVLLTQCVRLFPRIQQFPSTHTTGVWWTAVCVEPTPLHHVGCVNRTWTRKLNRHSWKCCISPITPFFVAERCLSLPSLSSVERDFSSFGALLLSCDDHGTDCLLVWNFRYSSKHDQQLKKRAQINCSAAKFSTDCRERQSRVGGISEDCSRMQ